MRGFFICKGGIWCHEKADSTAAVGSGGGQHCAGRGSLPLVSAGSGHCGPDHGNRRKCRSRHSGAERDGTVGCRDGAGRTARRGRGRCGTQHRNPESQCPGLYRGGCHRCLFLGPGNGLQRGGTAGNDPGVRLGVCRIGRRRDLFPGRRRIHPVWWRLYRQGGEEKH